MSKAQTNQEVAKQEVSEVVEKQKTVRAKLDMNMEVECRNISNGGLFYRSSKTGAEYLWANHNDVETLSVGELVTMKSSAGRFLNEPWLLIEDEEVVQYLGLTNLYRNLISPEELNAFFKLHPADMEDRLANAPKGTRSLIAEKASEMVSNKENCPLTGAQIHKLEQVLNIDLSFVK